MSSPGKLKAMNTPRRVSSAPAVYRPCKDSESTCVETLFVHPCVKIVAFNAAATAPSSMANTGREAEVTLTSPPWLDRTIAVGPLRIYRAPGSVAFLSCGSALQPILPKSQCWCIDENNAKFVLQIRWPNFWRIELPPSDELHRTSTAFREVLGSILQFERTRCPFQRTFDVEIVEESPVPIKKVPWTPKGLSSTIERSDETSISCHSGLASPPPGTLSESLQQHADSVPPRFHGVGLRTSSSVDHSQGTAVLDNPRHEHASTVASLVDEIQYRLDKHERLGAWYRGQQLLPANAHPLRSDSQCQDEANVSAWSTAEDQARSSHSPWAENEVAHRSKLCQGGQLSSTDNGYASGRVDSLRGLSHGSSSYLPASANSQELGLSKRPTLPSFHSEPRSQGHGKGVELIGPSMEQPIPNKEGHSRDSMSNLIEEPENRDVAEHGATGLPLFLIEKTYDALLTPPAHLIAMILKVAAKLSVGEWRGKIYGYDEDGEQIRVQWDYYSEDDLSD